MESDRIGALLDLVELRVSVHSALMALSKFAWDPDAGCVTLTRAHLRKILDAYSAGDVDDAGLSAWAEAVHGRDDIELEPSSRDVLAEALFELSSPELFGSMLTIVSDLEARLR